MSQPDWKDVLPTPPPGGRLHEAWMTSFEQPDAGLLVEHLLPSLLGTNHSLSQEIQERTLFFGELGTTLEALHGRLTIITSASHGQCEDSQYPWLWRYVSHFNVGAETHAVQHAKLWAFHWKVGEADLLELHVSSTNLTISAFKNQMQAGWQASVPLERNSKKKTAATWGQLIPFLEGLGKSSGEEATKRLQSLVSLLGRAECPEGITFVASIPGGKIAASQIKQFEPTEAHILTPTIGEWNEETISQWSQCAGVAPAKLRLKWIATSHPWADSSKWTLPRDAYQALVGKNVKVQCLAKDVRFSKEHRDGDERWSHAKLYLLRKGKQRWLLVTSANWSPSAWGASKPPRNFELGVAFLSDWKELEAVAGEFDSDIPPHLTDPERKPPESKLQWAEASWDGKCIALRARSADRMAAINAVVTFTGGKDDTVALVGSEASMPWSDPVCTPLIANFTQGSEALEIHVLDLRPLSELVKTPLPEVDPAVEKALREAFLLQRYGGQVVDPEPIPGPGGTRRQGLATGSVADYTVQAWIDARAAFGVVDAWSAALDEARAELSMFDRVQMDGHALQSLYAGRGDAASQLAADELRCRLKEM